MRLRFVVEFELHKLNPVERKPIFNFNECKAKAKQEFSSFRFQIFYYF